MSLGIAIKGPEGIVLAAESRTTVTSNIPTGAGVSLISSWFDSTHKVLSFSAPNRFVGAVTYGQATLGARSIHSFIPELEADIHLNPHLRMSVQDFSIHLGTFFNKQWTAAAATIPGMSELGFVVGGFDEGSAHGRLFSISVPHGPTPVELIPGDFGYSRGGQTDVVERLSLGYDSRVLAIAQAALALTPAQVATLKAALDPLQAQIPLNAMGLQDYVNLAIFWTRATIASQSLSLGLRGCGGPIDVAIITNTQELRFVQRKDVAGENGIT
jgi:hypothetical protein